jgi:hypothetical protein
MQKVSELFNVIYGNQLELNRLIIDRDNGVNFISRTSKNNGVSAKVKNIPNIQPSPAGLITVAVSGSVMEAFLQPEPFYTAFHVILLSPKLSLTEQEMLFYCSCLRANKYRYNFGRQANRTLKDLLLPSLSEIPNWVNGSNVDRYNYSNRPFSSKQLSINPEEWRSFKLADIFTFKKGKRLTKADMTNGDTPFIGSIDRNNGCRQLISREAIHTANTITINYNGSVGEAFYQSEPFWASDDVNVLYPKFGMNQYNALFIVTLIKMEKYRFNFGRKWHLDRMALSEIKLPVNQNGEIDWEYIENYIKSLPYSAAI